MSNPLIGVPNWADGTSLTASVLSGGSWTLPLTNLKDRKRSRVARSTGILAHQTRFQIALGAARRVGVLALPWHTLSREAKVRFLGYNTTAFNTLTYEAGMDVAVLGATNSRASTATYFDYTGLMRTAAINEIRDGHFINGKRHTLLEPGLTNLLLRSQEFANAAWTKTNVTVTDNLITAPDGTLTASRFLVPTTAASILTQSAVVASTGAAMSVYCRGGSGGTDVNEFLLYNTTTPALLCSASLNYNTGVLTVATGNGFVEALTGVNVGWFRVTLWSNTGITSGNTITAYVGFSGGVETANTWAYFWGAQLIATTIKTTCSYIPTTTVAAGRNTETFNFPFSSTYNGYSFYIKHTEIGGIAAAGSGRLLQIGNIANASPRLLIFNNGSPGYAILHDNGVTSLDSQCGLPTFGQEHEIRCTLAAADGKVTGYSSINGAVEVAGVTSAAVTPTNWSTTTILNFQPSGPIALQSVRIVSSAPPTMAEFRDLVYDSGWQYVWDDVFPTASIGSNDPRLVDQRYSAEDVLLAQAQHGFTLCPTPRLMTHVVCQILDYANADGYVDVGRLFVGNVYQPSTAPQSGDVRFSFESATTRDVADGGAAYFNVKPTRRIAELLFSHQPTDEAVANVQDFLMHYGLSQQVMFVYNPEDTYHRQRRSFLSTLQKLSALDYPFTDKNHFAVAFIEEL